MLKLCTELQCSSIFCIGLNSSHIRLRTVRSTFSCHLSHETWCQLSLFLFVDIVWDFFALFVFIMSSIVVGEEKRIFRVVSYHWQNLIFSRGRKALCSCCLVMNTLKNLVLTNNRNGYRGYFLYFFYDIQLSSFPLVGLIGELASSRLRVGIHFVLGQGSTVIILIYIQ